ncbi:MAG: ABC-F family ATP-binding cassette domain-containing protein, partial [Clostridia bacterium]|nr:ABC-F family ATP-binding cassette domain-containing protein [Clostridia bacterium]
QQQEIARLEAFIEQQRRWNREKNIIAAESRQKTIDKMVKLEKPVEREKAIKFSIASSDTRSNDVLSVRDLSMSFSGEDLFSDLSFELKRGDRLFVYGANGCGKSTLLKILTGRLKQNAGVFELGYNQTIGYYDQEQKLLNEDNRVIDELWDAYSSLSTTKIRSMLASFGFYGDDVFKSVSVLSGGERARLSIAKMVSSGVSLLILDEPTNHLDIESRETLEEAIINYDGTVIAVSHDRYFISKLATRILEIDKAGYGKGYALYDNGFEGFLSVRKKKEIPARKRDEGAGKASFNESKQRKNRLRSAKSRCEAIEKEISVTESLLVELREKTEDGSIAQDYIKLTEVYDSISGAEAKIDELYSELDSLESEISELEE